MAPSILLATNTIERLLRGDFYHSISLPQLLEELSEFPSDARIFGVGTTNWYRRQGELIATGTAGSPNLLWADPLSGPPNRVFDLRADPPKHYRDPNFFSLGASEDMEAVLFTFVRMAICPPTNSSHTRAANPEQPISEQVDKLCRDMNIGLAGVEVQGTFSRVEYQALEQVPVGELGDGGAGARFEELDVRSSTSLNSQWHMVGTFAFDATLQSLVSNVGEVAHIHGWSSSAGIGGHINLAVPAEDAVITVLPVRDLILKIRDLEVARRPAPELPSF